MNLIHIKKNMSIKLLHIKKYALAFEKKYIYSELAIYKDFKYINFILVSLITNLNNLFIKILKIGLLKIDWLVKFTFTPSLLLQLLHMGLLSFLTLLLPQPWHMYLRWNIPSLHAALLDKRTPSLPHDKHCTEGFGFTNPDFSKSLKLGLVV